MATRMKGPQKKDARAVGRTGGRTRRTTVPMTDGQRDDSEKYLHICRMKARKYSDRCRYISGRDFFQNAFLGLADAVKGYDESKGYPFEAYAERRMNGACIDLMRGDGLIRIPRTCRGEEVGYVSLGSRPRDSDDAMESWVLPPADLPPVGSELESMDTFDGWLRGMTDAERFIVEKYYGPEEWTMRRIGDHIGLTEGAVSLKHKAILARLRERARHPTYRDLAGYRKFATA